MTRDPTVGEADEYADQLVAAAEVLALVCYGLPARRPSRAQVIAWRDVLWRAWHASIDALTPAPGHKESRRAAIVATFDRLLSVAGEA